MDLICDKEQIGYFTPGEKDKFLDRASLWQFNDYRKTYAENIEAYEALAPFKDELDYTTSSQGVYTVAGNRNYVQLRAMDVSVVDPDYGARRFDVDFPKEDELAERKKSQLIPPSATAPIGEEIAAGSFRLYPAQVHAGTLRFFRRPAVPVFGFTQSGRVITYDSGTSTQLEWTEPYVNGVIFKAIQFMGINLDNKMLQEVGMLLPQADV